jgi:hypothetical protein
MWNASAERTTLTPWPREIRQRADSESQARSFALSALAQVYRVPQEAVVLTLSGETDGEYRFMVESASA